MIVWSGVDLSIARGEFVALLGPNGAGKTTLVQAMLGEIPLQRGTLEVLGRAPGGSRGNIGYLPQRHDSDGHARLRGIDLVRLGLEGARWGVPLPVPRRLWGDRRRAAEARVAEVIELVGAGDLVARPLSELSGGERQRVLIAQALAPEPSLLVLDEPLDSLDLPSQALIAALVQRICREAGVTVVLVAHDVNPLLGYLDRVVYLAGGSALSGRPEQVITGPDLSRLYGVPIEVLRASDGRLVVVGAPDAPSVHSPRHGHAHP
jgi:zinc/manganese transport system ATP-binding protein